VHGWDVSAFGNKDTWSDVQVKTIDQPPGGTASYLLKIWATRCKCGEFVSPEGYCVECKAGERCPDGFGAQTCNAGAYQPLPGQSECTSCAPARPDSAEQCFRLNAAHFTATASTLILAECSVLLRQGSFQANTGTTACQPCATGTVALEEGQVTCVACPAGEAAEDDGTRCGGCAAGRAPSAGQSGCEPCGAGTWSAAGDAACSPCTAGRFAGAPAADAAGQTDAECEGGCLAGYYCPAGSASATQTPCGHAAVYCPAGSAAPERCPAGSYTTSCASEQGDSGQMNVGKAGCTPQDAATDPADKREFCVACDPGHGCKNGVKKACEDYDANADAGGSRCAGDADLLVDKGWRSWAIASWSMLGTLGAVICFRSVSGKSRRSSDASEPERRRGSTLSSPSDNSLIHGIEMRNNPLSRGSQKPRGV